MKASIFALAAAITMLGAGCKPNQTTLTGQVFIAAGGVGTLRLSDVEVRLLDRREVANFLAKREVEIEAELANRMLALEFAKKALTAAQAESGQFNEQSFTNAEYLAVRQKRDDVQKQLDGVKQKCSTLGEQGANLCALAQAASEKAKYVLTREDQLKL